MSHEDNVVPLHRGDHEREITLALSSSTPRMVTWSNDGTLHLELRSWPAYSAPDNMELTWSPATKAWSDHFDGALLSPSVVEVLERSISPATLRYTRDLDFEAYLAVPGEHDGPDIFADDADVKVVW